MCDVFKEAVELYSDQPILKVEEVDPNPGPKDDSSWKKSAPLAEWKTWSYAEYYADCRKAAAGFIHLGFGQHDAVSVYGFNSPQWHISTLGAILGGRDFARSTDLTLSLTPIAGGVIAGIYPSDTADQVKFKVKHSGATVCVVQDDKKMEMLVGLANDLPKLKAPP